MQETATDANSRPPATWYLPPLVLFVGSLLLLLLLEQTAYSVHMLLGIGVALIFGTLTFFNFRDGHTLRGGLCVALVLLFNPALLVHLPHGTLRLAIAAPLLLVWLLAYRGQPRQLKSDLQLPSVAAYIIGVALTALCLYVHMYNDETRRQSAQETLYRHTFAQQVKAESEESPQEAAQQPPADRQQLMVQIHQAMSRFIDLQKDGSWIPSAPNANPVLGNFHMPGDSYRTVFLAEATLPAQDKEVARRFVLVAHNPVGEERQCQGCPALVGVFVFHAEDGRQTLERYAPFVMEAGDRGRVTLSRNSSTYRITEKAFMITLTTASAYQGYVLEHTSLLGYVNGGFHNLLTFTASQTPPDDCMPESNTSCVHEITSFALKHNGPSPTLRLNTTLKTVDLQGNTLEKTSTIYSFEDGPAPRFGSPISTGNYRKSFDRYPL